MKKFSLLLCIVALVAVMLVGATAFATTSGVTTYQDLFIGEYANHDNLNNSDPNVIIVFGTASVDEQVGVTERGIVVTKGEDNWYFKSYHWDATTGKFGVAIIRSTVEKGDYVARAYAMVGGVPEVGEEVSLNFAATLAQSETDIIVNKANPVDIKDYITVTNGNIDEVTYSVSAQNGEIVVENGVVSYGNKAGRYTVTATHTLSENSVTFNVMAYDEVYEITDKSQLATLNTDHANSYVKLMNDVYVETADMVEVNNYAYVIDGEFNGFFDGQFNQIKYDFRADIKDKLFRGVFKSVSGEVKNLKVEGFANMKGDGGGLFAGYLAKTGLVENCYINVASQQSASEKGNWNATQGIIIHNDGLVKGCVINVRSNKGNATSFGYGISLQQAGDGIWQNIASIIPTGDGGLYYPWYGGAYGAKMSAKQLINVVYYKGVDNFVSAVGDQITYGVKSETDNGDGTTTPVYDYILTPITEAQTIGESWATDTTGIKFNGELIAPVSNAADYQTTATGSIVFVPDDGKTTEQIAMYYRNALCNPSDFVYSSTNTDVVTVDSQGLVTKVGVGTAQIHVRSVFLNKQTVIPVTVADAVYAITSEEDLLALTPSKATELGASSPATLYAYLTTDLSFTKDNMAYYYYKSGSTKYYLYTIIPTGDYMSGLETPNNSTTQFQGVLDGKGFKIYRNFESDSSTYRPGGLVLTIGSTGIIRNLVYESVASTVGNISQQPFAATNYGFVDNCLINAGFTTRNMGSTYDSGADNYKQLRRHTRGAIIWKMDGSSNGGVVRNCIIKNAYYDAFASKTFFSPVVSADNVDMPLLDNTTVIDGQGIICTSGSSYSNPVAGHMNNVMYSETFAEYVTGAGKLITLKSLGTVDSTSKKHYSKNNSSTTAFYYYGTAFTDGRGRMGWTTDATAGTIAMNIDGVSKVVYSVPEEPEFTVQVDKAEIAVGETATASVVCSGNTTNIKVVLEAFNTKATISADGTITGVAEGTVTVTAINVLTKQKVTTTITITAAAAAA